MTRKKRIKRRAALTAASCLLVMALVVTVTVGASLAVTTGRALAASRSSAPNPNAWSANGDIYCIAHSGNTTYIGGDFTWVGTYPRNNIAHLLSGNTVDPSWNPDADDQVLALAASGPTVYAGGWFENIGWYKVGKGKK
jgi:hypothetical protein